jgi:stalled ribosome alternative rescue factor ArfA
MKMKQHKVLIPKFRHHETIKKSPKVERPKKGKLSYCRTKNVEIEI